MMHGLTDIVGYRTVNISGLGWPNMAGELSCFFSKLCYAVIVGSTASIALVLAGQPASGTLKVVTIPVGANEYRHPTALSSFTKVYPSCCF